jgi:hypothetical protein
MSETELIDLFEKTFRLPVSGRPELRPRADEDQVPQLHERRQSDQPMNFYD